jgi:hypothetical protein
MGASKNLEFAQIQGAGKILQRRIYSICKQEIFLQRSITSDLVAVVWQLSLMASSLISWDTTQLLCRLTFKLCRN